MKTEIKPDIGEEIIMKLEDLEFRINKLLEIRNEKELSNTPVSRNRTEEQA